MRLPIARRMELDERAWSRRSSGEAGKGSPKYFGLEPKLIHLPSSQEPWLVNGANSATFGLMVLTCLFACEDDMYPLRRVTC